MNIKDLLAKIKVIEESISKQAKTTEYKDKPARRRRSWIKEGKQEIGMESVGSSADLSISPATSESESPPASRSESPTTSESESPSTSGSQSPIERSTRHRESPIISAETIEIPEATKQQIEELKKAFPENAGDIDLIITHIKEEASKKDHEMPAALDLT